MDRERAETHLRLLAEAELRRATALRADSTMGQRHAPSLALAAEVLSAVGAVDVGTVDEIRCDLDFALVMRRPCPFDLASPGLGGQSQAGAVAAGEARALPPVPSDRHRDVSGLPPRREIPAAGIAASTMADRAGRSGAPDPGGPHRRRAVCSGLRADGGRRAAHRERLDRRIVRPARTCAGIGHTVAAHPPSVHRDR
jgi:hypothetical protein